MKKLFVSSTFVLLSFLFLTGCGNQQQPAAQAPAETPDAVTTEAPAASETPEATAPAAPEQQQPAAEAPKAEEKPAEAPKK